MNYAS